MENLLSFDKPKKIRNTDEHNEMYQSDSGIAGTYIPNMSREDTEKWKAKHIKGNDERIEIRKTINGVNLLIIVYKYPVKIKSTDWRSRIDNHNNINMSMNGKLDMTYDNLYDMVEAIREATEILL